MWILCFFLKLLSNEVKNLKITEDMCLISVSPEYGIATTFPIFEP